ncbi:MAG: ABC transporter permease [Myxococcota bacterium]|jgi:phospholipid/cholesterol/gamma-HCH transport system permease protein|nr:ABC transporter permease [Myxococcota bacterium]
MAIESAKPSEEEKSWSMGVADATLGALGRRTLSSFGVFWAILHMSWEILIRFFPPRIDGAELMRNLYNVGVRSFSIIVVTALFVGAIMVIQAGIYVEQYGATGLLGWGAGFATVRELSPIMIALMFNGRVGAKNTAELGTMKVTEQVDALRALAIDPISYLIMPRFVAMVSMMTLLVVLGDATALLGGAATSQFLLGVDHLVFFRSFVELIHVSDLMLGVYKATTFGVAMGIISCHYGYAVSGGAVGVGRAVNDSVVSSAIAIFVLNYLVTYIIT